MDTWPDVAALDVQPDQSAGLIAPELDMIDALGRPRCEAIGDRGGVKWQRVGVRRRVDLDAVLRTGRPLARRVQRGGEA